MWDGDTRCDFILVYSLLKVLFLSHPLQQKYPSSSYIVPCYQMTTKSSCYHICKYCNKFFGTEANLNRHLGAKKGACYEPHQLSIARRLLEIPRYDPHDPQDIPCDDEPEGGYQASGNTDFATELEETEEDSDTREPTSAFIVTSAPSPVIDLEGSTRSAGSVILARAAKSQELTKESSPNGLHRLRTTHGIGPETYGRGATVFEKRRNEEENDGISMYRGFCNAELFEFAEWTMSSEISQSAETNLLRTKIVSDCTRRSPKTSI